MSNAYTPRDPVADAEMFFGRTQALQDIAGYLRGNQSVAVVGPEKIGKTSLLLHLMRLETKAALGIGDDHLLVYLHCEKLGNGTHNEIFGQFCKHMIKALNDMGGPSEPALESAAANPSRSAFEGGVRRLNQRGLRVALILDDFEQLSANPNVDRSFFNALRSAAGRYQLVFLTASAQPLIDLTYAHGSHDIVSSPFFNIFALVFLGLLAEDEARALIRDPLQEAGAPMTPALEDFIYDLAGGHPLILQIACFHAHATGGDLNEIVRLTRQEMDALFLHDWEGLTEDEQRILHYLSDDWQEELNRTALRTALRDLVQKGLLVPEFGSYRYPSRAWAEFVATRR